MSINAEKPLDYHLDLGGARLAPPLRDSGILIVGSGNIVHNLRAMDPGTPDSGFDWAARFDEAARELLTASPADMVRLTEHPRLRRSRAHPPTISSRRCTSPVCSRRRNRPPPPDILIDGYTYGSLSMTSYAA